jgi:hypothetical protein
MSSYQQQHRFYPNAVVVLMQPRLTLSFSAALIPMLINHRLDPQQAQQVGAAGLAVTVGQAVAPLSEKLTSQHFARQCWGP